MQSKAAAASSTEHNWHPRHVKYAWTAIRCNPWSATLSHGVIQNQACHIDYGQTTGSG